MTQPISGGARERQDETGVRATAGLETGGLKPVGWALFCIVFATSGSVMMTALDTTIAAVALPHMQGALSASQDEINWVITSYITAATILTIPAGWIANRFGTKRTLVIAVAGFVLTSVLVGCAHSLNEMVCFRLLQGAFGAPLTPLSQTILLDAYEPKYQARGMAWWALGTTLGPMFGPNLGGWITEHWDWTWCFFINVPVGVLCVTLLIISVPETRTRKPAAFDWFGFFALSLFIAAFQLMLDRGSDQDWFASTEILAEAALAAFGLYVFMVHSLTSRESFVDFSALRDPNFANGTAFAFILSLTLIASAVLIPSFLQTLAGYPVGLAGELMTPRSIGMSIGMIATGRLATRFDPRLMAALGLAMVCYSMHRMSTWSLDVSSSEVMIAGSVQGLGTGFALVSMQAATFAAVPRAQRNGATTLFALFRNLGRSIGASALVALLVRNTQISHASLAASATPFNRALQSGAAQHFWNLKGPATRVALDGEITRQAAAIAYFDDFKVLMLLILMATPWMLMMRVRPAVRA